DVIMKPGWLDLVNSTNFDFYSAPLGDTRFLLNRSAFRRVGWFDERFTSLGFHEHDYLIRVLNLIPDSATIVDMHKQQLRHNPIGLEEYWLQPETDNFIRFKRKGGWAQASFRTTNQQKFFQEKWGTHPYKKVTGLHPQRLPREIDWYPFISKKYESLQITNPQYLLSEKEWETACQKYKANVCCPSPLLSVPGCRILAYCHLQDQTNPELLEKLYDHINRTNRLSPDSLGLIVLSESDEIASNDVGHNKCIRIYGKQQAGWHDEFVDLTDFSIDCGPQHHNIEGSDYDRQRLTFHVEKFLMLSLDELWRQLAEKNNKNRYVSRDNRVISVQALPEGPAFVDLGNSFFERKCYREALDYFKEAIEVDSENAEACAGIAKVALAEQFGEQDACDAIYQRPHALHAKNPELKELGCSPESANSNSVSIQNTKSSEIVRNVRDNSAALELKKRKYVVTLLGYTNPKHTNWYPWKMFHRVFTELGYSSEWTEIDDIDPASSQRRIFICWNEPDAKTLVALEKTKPGDVILQKLTSLGKGCEGVNWGNDARGFFRNWTWPIYKNVEDLYDSGVNIYAFGCRTNTELFPEKHRICEKLKGRIHWIPWGSSLYTWREIQDAKPVMNDFYCDIGFVGSIWGTAGRGNKDVVNEYLAPLLSGRKCVLAGMGTQIGSVDDNAHKGILRGSRLCPIINAASWKAEKGVQDRFWSVFTTGRFGVVDTEGVYDFFDEDEVVCETNPNEYIQKSLYFLEHVEKQLPYIEKIQARIKREYNYYLTWNNLLKRIIYEQ
ncbi:MAG: hypothetical protein HQ580_17970, partial [Planctomycetes bacterium]|nr:hypothetical protein [Planctomycetota bacterium]